jgi:hypothetical protein
MKTKEKNNRNKPCSCGSGKKYKKCCLGYTKRDYCENRNGVLGYDCTYVIPNDENSKGILTIEHWDGNPNNNQPDNLLTLCGNCARYKTNLCKDWETPGRNLKVVEGRNWVKPIDFIYKDWIAYCNSDTFPHIRNNIAIIVGKMGQGKTFSITEYMIPEWSKPKHNLQLVIVSAPQKGILDEIDFARSARKNDLLFTTSAIQALTWLESGERVIYTTNHQGLISKNGIKLYEYCKDNSVKHAFIIDEAHTWLCTSAKSYKQTMGHYMTKKGKYSASVYKLLSKVCSYNPYVFGLTATPNGEQTGRVPISKDETTFLIINKSCPVQLLLPKQAWIKEHGYLNLQDPTETFNKMAERIAEIENSKVNTGVKKSLLIQCCTDGNGSPYALDKVLGEVQEIYKELGVEDEHKICVMASERNESYTPNGDLQKENEESLKRMLNDMNDPLTVIIVVYKAQLGMNVHTMGGLMVLRNTDKDDGIGLSLTEFARQLMGRLVRINVADFDTFKEDFDYDFTKYYHSLSDTEKEHAIEANSFFVDIPADNKMWELAIQEFRNSYANNVQFATESLMLS